MDAADLTILFSVMLEVGFVAYLLWSDCRSRPEDCYEKKK